MENRADHYDIGSILVPICARLKDDTIGRISALHHIRVIGLPKPDFNRDFSTSDFEFVSNYPLSMVNEANVIAEALVRHMRKASHIILSDTASAIYDQGYRHASAGTAFAMDREEELLDELIDGMSVRRGLIELGCGTGRHSLNLARKFEKIFAYDFSPGMIEIAKRKRQSRFNNERPGAAGEVDFSVRDIEMFPPGADNDTPIDAIIGLFGMGSFIEDLSTAMFQWSSLLADNGKIALSFYNSRALTYSYPPPWRYTSLSAQLDVERQQLRVTLPSGQSFFIFCRPYVEDELLNDMGLFFEDLRLHSFPIISGILPPEYVGDIGNARLSELQQILFDIDRTLSIERGSLGNYFFVTGSKLTFSASTLFGSHLPQFSAAAYQDHLTSLGFEFEVLSHPSIMTGGEVSRSLIGEAPYLKAVLAFVNREGRNGGLQPHPVIFVIDARRRLDRALATEAIGSRSGSWRLASRGEILSIFSAERFPIPAVGFERGVEVVIDEDIPPDGEWWASGGSSTSSLKFQHGFPAMESMRRASLSKE